jgi:hypothetical protein
VKAAGRALAARALLAVVLPAAAAHANPALQQGRALFTGAEALTARSGGPHGTDLPPAASRCINCHSAPGLRPPSVAAGPSPRPSPASAAGAPQPAAVAFGPALSAAALLQPQTRRGGPPSRYDAQALCRLLREGQDPAGVLLSAAMPRYTLSDAQCRALWTLLTSDL